MYSMIFFQIYIWINKTATSIQFINIYIIFIWSLFGLIKNIKIIFYDFNIYEKKLISFQIKQIIFNRKFFIYTKC